MATSALSLFKGRSFPLSLNSARRKPTHKFSVKLTLNNPIPSPSIAMNDNTRRKLPVLLFDVMDTIVRDPFYHGVSAFFRMPMKGLIECKHPTVWIEFEKGLIDEVPDEMDYFFNIYSFSSFHPSGIMQFPPFWYNSELARRFFKDERYFDLEGLKNCMKRGYSYIDGVEELLHDLKKAGYEMRTFTNYPIWYLMIEDKLKLSTYLSWTFCSCIFGKRKPDPDFYLEVLNHLEVYPASCIFIDDRMKNVEAAIEAGFKGIMFKNADLLGKDLLIHGIDIPEKEHNGTQDVAECLD